LIFTALHHLARTNAMPRTLFFHEQFEFDWLADIGIVCEMRFFNKLSA
jgi:hypothetical protein